MVKPDDVGPLSNRDRGLALFTIIIIAITLAMLALLQHPQQVDQTNKQTRNNVRSFAVPPGTKPTVGRNVPERAQKRVSRAKVRAVNLDSKAKRYAFTLVSSRSEMACLIPLWERESGWSATSDNPTSSAYGIPQILGLEARTGDDYRAQVRAGLSYIKHRYGTPCKAWSFWQDHRWY